MASARQRPHARGGEASARGCDEAPVYPSKTSRALDPGMDATNRRLEAPHRRRATCLGAHGHLQASSWQRNRRGQLALPRLAPNLVAAGNPAPKQRQSRL